MHNIDELRKEMGTDPKTKTRLMTSFYEGVSGITVKILDYPTNPYKAIFDMATSTWGSRINKWPNITPENRFDVVKSVLEFKSLPLPMESISFTFAVEGCSRSAFDQIARSRIGFVFASMGWRDNDHSDIGFRIPQSIFDDTKARTDFIYVALKAKEVYHNLVTKGQSSWQDARALLPISACHNFSFACNYMALRSFSSKRLKFCEQADTVAVAWLIRDELSKKFPLLSSYLRPSCDVKGKCEYHQEYAMSEAFGCLFKECGRNSCVNTDGYATFNYSCTDINQLTKQLNIEIPHASSKIGCDTFDSLDTKDKILLMEN